MIDSDPRESDREFVTEIRRGLIIIMRAMIRRYHLAWLDFLPREENGIIRALAERNNLTLSG